MHKDSVSTLVATEQRITNIDKAQYQRGDGSCVSAIRDRRAVTVEDYRSESRWHEVAAAALVTGIPSCLSLPLMDSRGACLGGLNMYGETLARFGEASRRSAEVIARQAPLMLTQLQLLHLERAGPAREYEVAATLQRSLLPTLPALPGITSAAATWSATTGPGWR